MFVLQRLMLIMMAADAGGDGGSPTPAAPPADAGSGSQTPPEGQDAGGQKPPAAEPPKDAPQLPKFSSQLSPAKRDSEEYQKYIYKHGDLNELADDYVALNKRLERSLELPGKDAKPEEVKAFLQKLGVPEDEKGYKLDTSLVEKNPLYKDMETEMRKQFYRSGLTQRQAQGMWSLLSEGFKEATTYMDKQKQQQAQTFDARLAATLDKTYPVKSERDAAMTETAALFKQHLQRTGLGQLYKDSGLIYNPQFVMAMAAEEKSRSGGSFVQGNPGGKQEESYGAFGSSYSKDFIKETGRK